MMLEFTEIQLKNKLVIRDDIEVRGWSQKIAILDL